MQNLDQKVNQQQNTICLEQQTYASPENFTPTLLVMLETFGRSVSRITCHMSHVTCHVSHVTFFFYKVLKLIGGGSVINRAYPV